MFTKENFNFNLLKKKKKATLSVTKKMQIYILFVEAQYLTEKTRIYLVLVLEVDSSFLKIFVSFGLFRGKQQRGIGNRSTGLEGEKAASLELHARKFQLFHFFNPVSWKFFSH